MVDVTMAKKRMGRPKTSERQDVSIKFDRTLARKARLISEGRGISMAEYLSELSRPVIDRDLHRPLAAGLDPGAETGGSGDTPRAAVSRWTRNTAMSPSRAAGKARRS